MSTLSSPPEQSVRSFELIESVGEAYQIVFKNIRLLPAIICLPFVLDVLMILATEFTPLGEFIANEQIEAHWPPSGEYLLRLIATFGLLSVQFISIVLLYAAWYRFVLLGPRSHPQYFYPIERRHLRLFGYCWLMVIIVLVLTGLVVLTGFLLLGLGTTFTLPHLILIPIGFYVFLVIPLRLSYLFPAVAVDERYSLMDSWRHTRKQTLKLIGGSILCLLPATTVAGVLGADVSLGVSVSLGTDAAATPLFSPFLLEALAYLVGTFNSLVIAAFIAIAFRRSTGWIPDDPAAEAGPSEAL